MRQHPVFGPLASPKLTMALLVVFGVAIASATFMEADAGVDAARARVYGAVWFEVLLGLIGLNLLLALGRWKRFRPRQTGFVMIHVAVIVILVGAGITRFFGHEGTMGIREGGTSSTMYTREKHIQLGRGDDVASFPVLLYRSGPQSAGKDLEVGGLRFKVEVTEFWTRFGEEWVEGHEGPPAVEIVMAGADPRREVLVPGARSECGDVAVTFGTEISPTSRGAGVLALRSDGVRAQLAVTGSVPAETSLHGITVTIEQIMPGSAGSGAGLTSPVLRVRLEGADGVTTVRRVSAGDPRSGLPASGEPALFERFELTYRFEPGVELASGPSGHSMTANIDLELWRRDQVTLLPAGGLVALEAGDRLLSEAGGFDCTVARFLSAAVLTPVVVDDPDAEPSVRVRVTAEDGETASALVGFGSANSATITLGNRSYYVAWGPVPAAVPFSLRLDDFRMLTYPGSKNPFSYESHVILADPANGVVDQPVRIYMNHPLTYRGYKVFQSSYDEDHRGTILTVNYDPGRIPTYVGYTLIVLGFVLVLAKDLIWRRRREVRP